KSSDPDGNPLTFSWDFGDGSKAGNVNKPQHTYTTAKLFTAKVTVTDSRGAKTQATVKIDAGNTEPVPTIDAPAADHLFTVGETLTLIGHATDVDDGPLADSHLKWEVRLHHDTHFHPFMAATAGNNLPLIAPAPEDLLAATNSYLELILTATDSHGLSKTVSE